MAPYLSLLPIRKNKPQSSGLPRPKSNTASIKSSDHHNPSTEQQTQPFKSRQSLAAQDVSTLDFQHMLAPSAFDDSFGLLNDEQQPDFLVDQSLWTVGARTPAKTSSGAFTIDESDEEQSEQSRPQYDDSDADLPTLAGSPARSINVEASTPRSLQPSSTLSFRQSPSQPSEALFDEQEPSIDANYSSNSSHSQSLVTEESPELHDSISTAAQNREPSNDPILQQPPLRAHSPPSLDRPVDVAESVEEGESAIEEFEREVLQSAEHDPDASWTSRRSYDISKVDDLPQHAEDPQSEATQSAAVDRAGTGHPSADLECGTTVHASVLSGRDEVDTIQRLGEQAEEEGEASFAEQISEVAAEQQLTHDVEVENLVTISKTVADEQEEHPEAELAQPDRTGIESEDTPPPDTHVPVKFNDDSSELQDLSIPAEISNEAELSDERARASPDPADSAHPHPTPSPSPAPNLQPSFTRIVLPPPDSVPPKRMRAPHVFDTAPLPQPYKRGRASLAPNRAGRLQDIDPTTSQRRKSVASFTNAAWSHQAGSKSAQAPVNDGQLGAAVSPNASIQDDSLEVGHTFPAAISAPPSPEPPIVQRRIEASPEEAHVAAVSADARPLSPLSSLRYDRSASSPDISLPLSPARRDAGSFEGDITLPLMGAPLMFNSTTSDRGQSTPARTRPRSRPTTTEEIGATWKSRPAAVPVAVEPIEEVTEEETSLELSTRRSPSPAVAGDSDVVKKPPEEGSQSIDEREIEKESQPALHPQERLSSSPTACPPPSSSPAPNAEVPLQSDEHASARSPQPAADRIIRVSLAPPSDSAPALETARAAAAGTLRKSRHHSVAVPTLAAKRSIRVSLAAPPPPTRRESLASRRASVAAIQHLKHAGNLKSSGHKKSVRASVASSKPASSALPEENEPARPARVLKSSPALQDALEGRGNDEPQAEEVNHSPKTAEPHSASQEPGNPVCIPRTKEPSFVQTTTTAPAPPPDAETAVPVKSPNAEPAALPPSASATKPAALTLPTSFSFGASSDARTREQERQRRKEERERREKRIGEALQAKKQGLKRDAAWKKPSAPKDHVKRKLATSVSQNKRQRTAPESVKAAPVPPVLAPTVPKRLSEVGDRSATARELPPLKRMSTSVHGDDSEAIASANTSSSLLVLKLTKSTLEANRVAAGPKLDLNRRISTFLESLGDARAAEEDQSSGGLLQVNSNVESKADEKPALMESALETLCAAPPSKAPTPPPPPPPPPPPQPTVTAVRKRTHSATDRPKDPAAFSKLVENGPQRHRVAISSTTTTTAKPFSFGTTRTKRPANSIASSVSSVASPAFSERLSLWKQREKETLSQVKRRQPTVPSLPFKTKNVVVPVPRPASAMEGPVAKKVRTVTTVANRDPVQGRKGKENPPPRPAALVMKEIDLKKQANRQVVKTLSRGVAEEMEKRLQEKLEWSERQKKREEEVKKRKEQQRLEEAVSSSHCSTLACALD
ncbi:uncharacterized protein JCM15063_003537 [Sporobolomyces koalae]|uniref:uncharacterized protein n=1 Tax=Sporobolomyces koalae TaxID=500713 RepID=UPI00316EF854